MGGRGRSKPTDTGFTWYEYHVVYKYRNTHYLVQHDETHNVATPMMSKTPNVTYVTLNDKGEIKSVSVYKDRIQQYCIDLDKPHHGILPHVHHCDKTTGIRKKEKDSEMNLTKDMERKLKTIKNTFAKHKKEMLGL